MSREDVDAHFDELYALKTRNGARHETGAVDHARRLGAVLASHDDTRAEDIETSAARGCRLAEFPTTEEAAEACRGAGIAVMMGAPNLLRGGSHFGNVGAGVLAERGLLDVLSSDYAPSALLMGAVRLGLETQDMAAGLRTVTAAPAAVAGLSDRGRIAPGLWGDLVRFSLVEGLPITRAAWSRGHRVA